MTSALPRPARLAATALLLGLALLPVGCAYARDRLLDLSDVIDPKIGTGIGVGAKVEISEYLGVGVGVGVNAYLREWYGRRSYETYGDKFVHLGAFGQDGGMWGLADDAGVRRRAETYALLINLTAVADHVGRYDVFGYSDAWVLPEGYEVPPLYTRWRVGGEIMIPALSFGLYLNLGELADFLLGLGRIDFAGDDGMSKADTFSLGVAPAAEEESMGPQRRWKQSSKSH